MEKLLVLVDEPDLRFKVCAFPGRKKSGFEATYDALRNDDQKHIDIVVELLAKHGTEINKFCSRKSPISVPAKHHEQLWELRPKDGGPVRICYFLRHPAPRLVSVPLKGKAEVAPLPKPEVILTHLFFKPNPRVQDQEFERADAIRSQILKEDWNS